jgi:hypothetical protein
MAVDRVSWEHHLTPDGREQATHDSMFTGKDEVAPPTNRVETWLEKTTQSSPYSPEVNSWNKIWTSPTATEEELKTLHEKFPHELDGKERGFVDVLKQD